MKTTVIIVAAGMGRRMGAGKTKQLIEIGGFPIIYHTLKRFELMDIINEIILVVKKDEAHYIEESIVRKYHFDKVNQIVNGGVERSDSVKKGLEADNGSDIILIHDGARPFVKEDAIKNLIKKTMEEGAAILAVPVKDTIKSVDGLSVIETYDRSSLWMVQTPQAFRGPIIKQAFEHYDTIEGVIYDDSMLVESMNEKVYVVEGCYTNIKITTQSDLIIGEAIYHSIKGEENV